MWKNMIFLPTIVLLMTFAASLGLVMVASAQTRTVGVSVGNKFRYSETISWSSNDPNATPPSYLADENSTEWLELTVAAISGTNITGQLLSHYKNGTEINRNAWVDINTGDSGNGELTYSIISANLAVGDSVYSVYYPTLVINETMPRTYLGSVRDTNHLNMTSPPGLQITHINLYWDKSTGVLVENLQEYTSLYDPAEEYTTTWSLYSQITSSNVWPVIPEFSDWTLSLPILMGLTAATIIVVKQKQLKRPIC